MRISDWSSDVCSSDLQVLIDDEKVRALQINLADVNETMSTAWRSMYVNDFIDRGRVKRVYLQGNMDSRLSPEDFGKWHVRNAQGAMMPFSAFASGQWSYEIGRASCRDRVCQEE